MKISRRFLTLVYMFFHELTLLYKISGKTEQFLSLKLDFLNKINYTTVENRESGENGDNDETRENNAIFVDDENEDFLKKMVRSVFISCIVPFVHMVNAFACMVIIVMFTFAVDSHFYDTLTSTLLNFFQFNFASKNADIYGTSPFHWALTDGIWTVFGLLPVLVVLSLTYSGQKAGNSNADQTHSKSPFKSPHFSPSAPSQSTSSRNPHNSLSNGLFPTTLFSLFLFSIPAHKEHRFILPLVPFIFLYLALKTEELKKYFPRIFKIIILANTIVNVVLAFYFSTFHQAAPQILVKYFQKVLPTYDPGEKFKFVEGGFVEPQVNQNSGFESSFIDFLWYEDEEEDRSDVDSELYDDFRDTGVVPNDGNYVISSRRIPNIVTIYSLLPCHSLPAYGFYHKIRSNFLQLKQLECPPKQYRLPKSSKSHIYNNGDQSMPSISTLERNKVEKISNFIILYQKDLLNTPWNSPIVFQTWLHKNRFEKKFCVHHMHFPQMLGDNHDTHVCLFEKVRNLKQF